MKWYLKAFRNYAGFSGRARRQEYWMYTLFCIIFLIIAMILDNVFGTTFYRLPYGLFYCIYGLVTFLPGLAVGVRRLHDTNRSGAAILLALIPIVGGILLLIYMCTEGDRGPNKYGPDPKENTAEATVIS